jgi:ABC-type dipeptide/oligopeptide/nickel transport system permease component/ABC-type transport system substrate-binding protein
MPTPTSSTPRARALSGWLRHPVRLLLTFTTLFAILFVVGALLQRGATGTLPDELSSPEVVAQYNRIRSPVLDFSNAPPLALEVDYSEGERAAWFPKGESPLLAGLVREGKLPPVAERVGPEPLVMRGEDGIGNYGGDWWMLASDIDQVRLFLTYIVANNTLVRTSPYGEPLVPHVARAVVPSDDYKVWTVHLRRGIRWSDGHPFTAEDIVFWWEHMVKHPVTGVIPETMRVEGQAGYVEKVDDYTVRYVFPASNPGFRWVQSSAAGSLYMAGPAHYLRQFHSVLGDQELIRRTSEENKIRPELVMRLRNSPMNPERPSLSPWLLRTYRDNGPWTLVRNPYYFAVDAQGNQLPYIDRIVFRQVSAKLLAKSIMDGSASAIMAVEGEYASLMNQRESGNYHVRHWYAGGAGQVLILPNRQLPAEDDDPVALGRRELLRTAEFRRALALAINRERIIGAEFMGFGKPAALGPGPGEPGYDPEHLAANTEYDPERANRILDALGLTRRDEEGFRTLPDGSRMTFRLVSTMVSGPLLFVRDDWKNVGIRVIVQQRPHRLMILERERADFAAVDGAIAPSWGAYGAGAHYFSWYHSGGLHGDTNALAMSVQPSALEQELMRKGERAAVTPDPEERLALLRDVLKAAREQVWSISVLPPSAAQAQAMLVVKNGLRGVPELAYSSFAYGTPNNTGPETWFWENPGTINGEPATPEYLADRTGSLLSEIQQVTLPPRQVPAGTGQAIRETSAFKAGWVLQAALWLTVGLFIVMSALKHPFVLRRLSLMVPTLVVISIIVYVGIQLPPGSYLDTRIQSLEAQGLRQQAMQEVADLRERFHLDDSLVKNYFRWTGLLWFVTYQPDDKGLLQGNLGYSMVSLRPVNELVGDRVLLTFALSLGTILFTWIMAIPVGVYSAVRQYSPGDYIMTVLGFLGMCIPNFIFALVLMLLSRQLFGVTISGLFSSQFTMQDYWNWAKFVDLLKHLWLPVVVIGLAGTAGMIRVMRANLLDELKKPYVVTARAKGVRPVKLLFKYPFRLALNPFISGIGGILPELISGGAIVSIILSLPTVGPLLLDAVMIEDIYMAGSLLLILSTLSVVGVLVSDLLLMVLDPRIRMSGGRTR